MDSSAVPKVSVIIPLYNKAPYIKRALDSVFAQTVQDFEIVVVGGNSTDGGEDIVLGYSDPRIRFVKEAGKGVSAARNQGVDAARAELVAFLDADDEWLPEFLETILRLREKWPDAGMYGTGYYTVGNDKNRVKANILKMLSPTLKEGSIKNYFKEAIKYPKMIILTSGMVVNKKVFHDIGGFPCGYSQNEDRYLRAMIALKYDIVYSPERKAIYHLELSEYDSRCQKYLSDPFAKYFDVNSSSLRDRDDYRDVLLFADGPRLSLSCANLVNGHDLKFIREEIKKIKSKRLIVEKYTLYLLSYIPINNNIKLSIMLAMDYFRKIGLRIYLR